MKGQCGSGSVTVHLALSASAADKEQNRDAAVKLGRNYNVISHSCDGGILPVRSCIWVSNLGTRARVELQDHVLCCADMRQPCVGLLTTHLLRRYQNRINLR